MKKEWGKCGKKNRLKKWEENFTVGAQEYEGIHDLKNYKEADKTSHRITGKHRRNLAASWF